MNKKFFLALTSGLLSLSLAGCVNPTPAPDPQPGPDPEPQPEPEPEQTEEGKQEALQRALEADIALSGGNGLLDETTGTRNLISWGGSLSLLKQYTTRIKGVTYVVNIEWDYDREKYGAPDQNATYKYEEGHEDDPVLAKVKKWETDNQDELKMYCSFAFDEKQHDFDFFGTLSIDDYSEDIAFLAKLDSREMKYEDMDLDTFYEVAKTTAGKYYFKNWMQSEGDKLGQIKGDYMFDHGTKITMSGKITYLAADKNFAYLAAGDKVISLYHIDYLDAGDQGNFAVGNYVTTNVYISSYYGAPQVANFTGTEVHASAQEAGIVEPVSEPLEVTPANLSGTFTEGGNRFNQFSAYHYRTARVTGKLVKSSIPSSASVGGRFKFQLKDNAGNIATIAYNKHCKFSQGWLDALKNIADGKEISVTGGLTYESTNEKTPSSFNPGNEGVWTIVPLVEEGSIVVSR